MGSIIDVKSVRIIDNKGYAKRKYFKTLKSEIQRKWYTI